MPAFFTVLVFKLTLLIDPIFSSSGFKLVEEGQHLRKEAQQLESEGLWKIESAVAGSEAEDFYRLLRGAVSHPPISSIPTPLKRCCPAPATTVSKLPPQESKQMGSEVSNPVVSKAELAPEASSPGGLQALEVAI